MKQEKQPLIDIVVLVHDKADWADLCTKAVESFTKNPYRLIVVDMASVEEKTQALFKSLEERGHTVLRLNANKSFSNGVNAGANLGSSKFICVLNDDALVTEGWDTAMVQDAGTKEVGMVGARSNYAAGAMGDPSFKGDVPYLAFVCVMFRRDVFNQVGPLDEETFDGFSSEDIDYSWRVIKSGLKLKVSDGAYVYHAGSRTLMKQLSSSGRTSVSPEEAAVVQEGLRRNNEKYNARLEQKWGKDWVKKYTKMSQSILIATYHAEDHTRVEFMKHVLQLKRHGNLGFSFYSHQRSPIHLARQLVCDYACDQGFDWLIQLDDDATFPHDIVGRLITHNKPAVCTIAYQRAAPYNTCVFDLGDKKIEDRQALLGTTMNGIEHTGLRKVDISGFHCSVLHMDVIRAMRNHRSEEHPDGIRRYFGGFEEKVGEDFAFCLNMRKVGMPLYVDTGIISGHIGASIVVDEQYKKDYQAGRVR